MSIGNFVKSVGSKSSCGVLAIDKMNKHTSKRLSSFRGASVTLIGDIQKVTLKELCGLAKMGG